MHSELIPLWGWILFYAMVLLMLAIDLKSFGRKGQHEVSISEALHMTVVWIVVSLLFCAGIYFFYPIDPHQKALEFLSGYLIEKSLSVDNLFVFLLLFTFFGVERKYQHEVLFWESSEPSSCAASSSSSVLPSSRASSGYSPSSACSFSIAVQRCSPTTRKHSPTPRVISSYGCSAASSPSPTACMVGSSG